MAQAASWGAASWGLPAPHRTAAVCQAPTAGVDGHRYCASCPPVVLQQESELSYTGLCPTMRLLGESAFLTRR